MLVSEIVRRAYIMAGVIASGQATPTSFANDGLATLNELLDSWVADGLDVGLADLSQSDDITDTSLTYCLRMNLSQIFSEENGREASRFVQAEAARTKGALMAWEGENELKYDSALVYGTRYDITRDR